MLNALPLQLRPTAIDRNLGAGGEGRIEREEEDGLGDFLRLSPALHRDHTCHLLPNLGGLVFTGKHFADELFSAKKDAMVVVKAF
jgi:hypothetical protein